MPTGHADSGTLGQLLAERYAAWHTATAKKRLQARLDRIRTRTYPLKIQYDCRTCKAHWTFRPETLAGIVLSELALTARVVTLP
jgi:hypothetical protein